MTELITVTDTEVEIHDPTAFFERHYAAWRALNEWIKFHDIDPKLVPMCSRIVRNTTACRVEYDEIVVEPDGSKATAWDGEDLVWVTRRVHSQGEAPPLPWPRELWEVANRGD